MSTELLERPKTETRRAHRYCIIGLNDDTTPIEFVVHLIVVKFGHTVERAAELALEVHQNGSAIFGEDFIRDIAETKSMECNLFAKEHGFEFKTTFEPQL